MIKYLKIVFLVFAVAVILELAFLLFANIFSFKRCPRVLNYPDESGLGCARTDGLNPYHGASFVLELDRIVNNGRQIFLVFKYPALGGLINVPIYFRAGMVPRGGGDVQATPTVNICDLYARVPCERIPPGRLTEIFKPGQVLAPKAYSEVAFSTTDGYFMSCAQIQKDFVKNAVTYKSVFSSFFFQNPKGCYPSIGQIFYK